MRVFECFLSGLAGLLGAGIPLCGLGELVFYLTNTTEDDRRNRYTPSALVVGIYTAGVAAMVIGGSIGLGCIILRALGDK